MKRLFFCPKNFASKIRESECSGEYYPRYKRGNGFEVENCFHSEQGIRFYQWLFSIFIVPN